MKGGWPDFDKYFPENTNFILINHGKVTPITPKYAKRILWWDSNSMYLKVSCIPFLSNIVLMSMTYPSQPEDNFLYMILGAYLLVGFISLAIASIATISKKHTIEKRRSLYKHSRVNTGGSEVK